MKTNEIKYWDLLAKYFAHECTDEEQKVLNGWIEESAEHKKLFNNIENDQEIINNYKSMERVNVDSAWDNLKSRIEASEMEKEEKRKTINVSRILRYAAMIVIVAGLGFLFTKIYHENFGYYSMAQYTAENEVSNEIILPDGTKVYLNADSKLRYPETFEGKHRKVKLDGEAFFDVTKNKEQPFIIEAKSAEIKVLGTSFNVRTAIDNDVEVYVETGRVELSRKQIKENTVIVDPGNVGIVNKTVIRKHKNEDPNILAWKTRNIVFRDDYLGDVFKTLNRVYHVDIRTDNDEILKYRLTSTFKNQDIKSVIEVICVTFNLKAIDKNDEIIIVKS
ncbi:MAG: FecR domain-containing protein [Bacteroidales bacterium]